METVEQEIAAYVMSDGRVPFEQWFENLKDLRAQAAILTRIDRMLIGNFGSYRSLKDGVCELKIPLGPGYRVYFGKIGLKLVLFLCGGDKSSQNRDIRKAVSYWEDYLRRCYHEKAKRKLSIITD